MSTYSVAASIQTDKTCVTLGSWPTSAPVTRKASSTISFVDVIDYQGLLHFFYPPSAVNDDDRTQENDAIRKSSDFPPQSCVVDWMPFCQ
jgi:hypothetical protein